MNSDLPTSQQKTRAKPFLDPRRAWEKFTFPDSSIQEPERRRRVRLLSYLLVTLFLAAIAAVILNWLAEGPSFNSSWILIDAVIFSIAYGLSRTKHYKIAVALTLIVMWVSILYASILNQKSEDLFFLMLIALFSSLFLSPRLTVLSSAAMLATVLLLPVIYPEFSILEILEETFLIGLTGAIATVTAIVQYQDSQLIEQQSRELSATLNEVIQGREALQQSKTRLTNILDNAAEAIISVDESQHIILFNKE